MKKKCENNYKFQSIKNINAFDVVEESFGYHPDTYSMERLSR